MRKLLLCGLGLFLLGLAACDPGEPRCAECSTDFSDAQCDAIAHAAGCERGESYLAQEFCDGTRRGCRFLGCPTDDAIFCTDPPGDPDGGT